MGFINKLVIKKNIILIYLIFITFMLFILSGCGKDKEDMHDMNMRHGDGTSSSVDGYDFKAITHDEDSGKFRFKVDYHNKTLKDNDFKIESTKKLHMYAVRDDFNIYRHVHPKISKNGIWSVRLNNLEAGDYKFYISFIHNNDHVILSVDEDKHGEDKKIYPSILHELKDMHGNAEYYWNTVDGYTVTIKSENKMDMGSMNMANMDSMNHKLYIRIDKDPRGVIPANELDNYLDQKAHITAVKKDDKSFTHIHPMPAKISTSFTLVGNMYMPMEGNNDWILYVEFKYKGKITTVPVEVKM